MEQMTYEQASSLLGKHHVQVRKAVSHGILTLIPGTEYRKHLPRKQVELFQGKRLSLSALSRSELEQWEEYKKEAIGEHDFFLDTLRQYKEDPAKLRTVAQVLQEIFIDAAKYIDPLALGKN